MNETTAVPEYPPYICLVCLRRFTYPLGLPGGSAVCCPYCHATNFAHTDSVFPGGPCVKEEPMPYYCQKCYERFVIPLKEGGKDRCPWCGSIDFGTEVLPKTEKAEASWGHPMFEQITQEELEHHRQKNKDYAGGGRPLGNFERVAAILALYPGLRLDNPVVVAMVYMMKQLDCVLWMLATGREGEVEDIDARLVDVHIYGKLCRILYKEWKERQQQAT